MTPAQCRGARAMLDMTRERLATAAGVAERTVVDFERGAPVPLANNLDAMRRALELAGIEFIAENGGGAGVRLRRTAADAPAPAPTSLGRLGR